MYIAISGQSGAGKSTLIPLVSAELKTAAVLEDTKYLPAYIAWLEKRGTLYEAQQQFLGRAYLLQQKALIRGGIQERTIYENYEVAVRYYYKKGMLTDNEFESLTMTYEDMCNQVRSPDLLFNLTASVDDLLERRLRRGKLHDLSISASEIMEIETYYQSMLFSWTRCPVFNIDTSSLQIQAAASLIASIVRDIQIKKRG